MKLKWKQIAAIAGVLLLLLLYCATFIFAVFDIPNADKMFATSLYGTIAVPILLWIYIWLFDKYKHRNDPPEE